MVLFYASAILAALVTSAVAQSSSGPEVSSQCQSSIASIATSPDAQCLNAGAVLPIFLGNSSTSIVGPINTWLTGLCSKDACSNQTLAAFVTNITQGCSSELSSLGLNNGNVTTSVQEFYPSVRQIVCLKDNNTNELCPVEGLYDIQNATGTISVDNVFSLIPQIISGGLPVGVGQNATCNNCTKAAYNILLSNVPQAITSNDNSTISNQCGASFLDGKTPTGISETAAGSSLPKSKSNGNSGALRSVALWDGLTALAGLGIFLTALL